MSLHQRGSPGHCSNAHLNLTLPIAARHPGGDSVQQGDLGMFVATHPRNIPAAYHRPIGQIIARWGVAELYLQSIIWHVWQIRDPKVARLLTWDLNAVAKVNLFKRLSPRWITDPRLRTDLAEIAKEADDLRTKRNKLAHGVWGYTPGAKRLFLANARNEKSIQPKAEFVSVTDIRQWAKDLNQLNARLIKLHKRLRAPAP